jgi:L-threonylcarbamoyladenylate synthase
VECLENNAENVGKAVRILKKGGIVAHPADTCFGLAGDLTIKGALRKLQQIKGRDADKPMSIMLPPFMKPILGEFALLNDFSEMVCEKLLPGPVTIILPKGPRIPDYFFPEISTVGIRIPYSTKDFDLMMKYPHPLITTSANLSDEPVSRNCQELINTFKDSRFQPDLILDGILEGDGRPSTVISPEGDKITILREGPMGKKQIESILGIRT